MIEDYQNEHRKKVTRVRSVMDYIMGAIIILIGVYFLLYETLGLNVLAGFLFCTVSGGCTGDIKRIIINDQKA
jgi:hypothetical protein